MMRFRLLLGLVLAVWLAWLVPSLNPTAGVSTTVRAQTSNSRIYLPLVLRGCTPVELIQDGGFEAGLPNPVWQTSSNMFSDILDDTPNPPPHTGNWKAWLGGDNLIQETLWQTFTVPPDVLSLQISYWRWIDTFETSHPFDTLEVQLRDAAGTPLQTLEILTDGDAASGWQQSVLTITPAYAGQTLQLAFVAQTDDSNPTSFFLDDISVLKTCSAP